MTEITEDDVERAARAILGVRFGADAAALFEPVPDDFPQATEARTTFARRVGEAYAEARAALTAAFASRPSQGGEWVMVPREPTPEMTHAALNRSRQQNWPELPTGKELLPKSYELWAATEVYRAMLSATPSPYGVEELVERAFKDGLAYGSNVEGADPDIAWQHSRARLLLKESGE